MTPVELSPTMKELLAASSAVPYPLGIGGNLDIRDTEREIVHTPPRSKEELVEEAPQIIAAWAAAETDEAVDVMGETLSDFAKEWQERQIMDACSRYVYPEPIHPIIPLRYWIAVLMGTTVVALVFLAVYLLLFGKVGL